jgi:hypothetical protein
LITRDRAEIDVLLQDAGIGIERCWHDATCSGVVTARTPWDRVEHVTTTLEGTGLAVGVARVELPDSEVTVQ